MSTKTNNIYTLATIYSEYILRNRDRVKSKINWYKTKWSKKDIH